MGIRELSHLSGGGSGEKGGSIGGAAASGVSGGVGGAATAGNPIWTDENDVTHYPGRITIDDDGKVTIPGAGTYDPETQTFTDLNGVTHFPDGSTVGPIQVSHDPDPGSGITDEDGNTYFPDGSWRDADGNAYDGNIYGEPETGDYTDSEGNVHHQDGSVTTLDGTT